MSKSTKTKQSEIGNAGAPSPAAQDIASGGNVAKRRALVAGINEYASPNQLPSCVNDATTFATMLKQEYGFDNVVVRTDAEVTKAQLLSDLDTLFEGAAAGDQLVFFFSGHGYRQAQDGTLDSVLVTQDSQFFSDTELAQKMAGIPDGVLTIVLDACFSGGDEKAFVTREGRVEIGKIKRWTPSPSDQSRPANPQAETTRIEPFGYLSPLSGPNLARHLLSSHGKALDQPYRVSELQDENSKGLLLSACLYNEEAAASTSQTDGLSAFTFALTNSARALGVQATAKNVIAQAGSALRTLGFDQTPMLKEPMQPPDLGDASFVLLNHEAAGAASAAGAPTEAPAAGTSPDQTFMQSLALLAGLLFPTNQQGVNVMTMENNQKDFINTLSTLGNVVIPMVSVLQQKGFSIGDAARIAVAFAPPLANKQNADAQTSGKDWTNIVAAAIPFILGQQQPAGKDWTNIVAAAIPFILGQQRMAQQPAGKDWTDIVAATLPFVLGQQQMAQQPVAKDWTNIVAAAIPFILGQQQMAPQPDGKDWTDIVAATLPFVLGQQSQTADKSFFSSVGTALHVIGTVAPIIAAAQKSKNFLDPDMPYTNGAWRPGFPPPYVS